MSIQNKIIARDGACSLRKAWLVRDAISRRCSLVDLQGIQMRLHRLQDMSSTNTNEEQKVLKPCESDVVLTCPAEGREKSLMGVVTADLPISIAHHLMAHRSIAHFSLTLKTRVASSYVLAGKCQSDGTFCIKIQSWASSRRFSLEEEGETYEDGGQEAGLVGIDGWQTRTPSEIDSLCCDVLRKCTMGQVVDWGGMLCLELFDDAEEVSEAASGVLQWKRIWRLVLNIASADDEALVAVRVWDRLNAQFSNDGAKSARDEDRASGIYVIDGGREGGTKKRKRAAKEERKAKKEKKEKKGKKRQKKLRRHARDVASDLGGGA